MHVLIAEDDHDLAQLVGQCARVLWPGCGLTYAPDGREALRRFAAESPDLVILDVTMPPPDGLAVCREIRATSTVPILMLTGHTDLAAEVKALGLGADDYLTKPFDVVRLLARLRSLARRAATRATHSQPSHTAGTPGALTLDLAAREVRVGSAPVNLSPTEYLILELLARSSGAAVPQRALLEHAWGNARATTSHSLKVYINRLRRKLGDRPGRPGVIQTSRGIGYRLSADQVQIITS
jgi:DNA-binding response OmpR family regulator